MPIPLSLITPGSPIVTSSGLGQNTSQQIVQGVTSELPGSNQSVQASGTHGIQPEPTDPMHLMVLLKDARSILGNKT